MILLSETQIRCPTKSQQHLTHLSYILQNIIEDQKGFFHLDSEPQTLAAKAHRCAYGKDGDYFSKPSVEDVFEKVFTSNHKFAKI